MLIYKAFRWVQHLQNLTSSDLNSVKNSYFFWCLIMALIFRHFGTSWCQNARFWDPLWRPAGHQMAPKIGQVAPKCSPFLKDGAPFSRPTFTLISWSAHGHHFDRFWMDLGWILMDFFIISCAFRKHLCNKICRLPTSSDTKRIDHNVWENAKSRQELTKTKS